MKNLEQFKIDRKDLATIGGGRRTPITLKPYGLDWPIRIIKECPGLFCVPTLDFTLRGVQSMEAPSREEGGMASRGE